MTDYGRSGKNGAKKESGADSTPATESKATESKAEEKPASKPAAAGAGEKTAS